MLLNLNVSAGQQLGAYPQTPSIIPGFLSLMTMLHWHTHWRYYNTANQQE